MRLYTSDGGVKLLRRKGGEVERQHRLNVGRLPVAYRSEAEGGLLYVMDGAVTAFQKDPGEPGALGGGDNVGGWGRGGEGRPVASQPGVASK